MRFRLRQLGRSLASIGWLLLLLIPILGALLLQFGAVLGAQSPFLILGVAGAVLGLVHWRRRDGVFLKQLAVPGWQLLLVEYQLLLLPLTALLLIFRDVQWSTFTHHLLAIVCAFLPVSTYESYRKWSFPLPRLLPVQAFEWRCGLRRNGFWLLPLYSLALIFAHYPPVPLLMVLVTVILATSFFDKLESMSMLVVFYPGILWRKVVLSNLVLHFFLLPHYLLFLFFHTTIWYILLAAVLVAQLLQMTAIYFKYAAYLPHRRKANNSNVLGGLIICSLIPFLFPLLLLAVVYYGVQARRRLDYFFEPQS